jgi:hypothetical protein
MSFIRFLKTKPKSKTPTYNKAITMKTMSIRIENVLLQVEYQYIPGKAGNRTGSPDNWSEGEQEEIYIESICVQSSNQNISELLDEKIITKIETCIHNLEQ